MNSMYKKLLAGFLGIMLMGATAMAQNEPAVQPQQDAAAQANMHQGCSASQSINFVPVQSCYAPNTGVYAVIDSVDCAVDILRATDKGLEKVAHYVTDSLEKRYDLANILRPQSVQIKGEYVVFLATANNDTSYLGVLDMNGNLVNRIDFGCSNYAFGFDCANRQIVVMGKNPVGYDINFVSLENCLANMTLSSTEPFHYHKPKQSERIKDADPYGIGVACVAIAVVFLALLCITLILKGYGKSIVSIQRHRAKKAGQPKSQATAPGDVYAAIAAALYLMNEEQHDDENGVITINKVERAWTPWNAKFYNMNHYFKTRR